MFNKKKTPQPLPEIERVVDVRRGDIVILRCDVVMAKAQMDTIRDHLKGFEDSGVKFMVLDKCMSVETVLRFEPDYDDEEPPPESPSHL